MIHAHLSVILGKPLGRRLTPALSGKAPNESFQIHPESQKGPRPLEGVVRRNRL